MPQKRKLGLSSLQVSPLCFGGNVFGWTVPEPTAFQLLDAFTDAGFNFVDTADVYSKWIPGNQGGESETIIGNWFRKTGKRAQLVLATKVGMMTPSGEKKLSRSTILKCVDDSLRRLQTDYIDLYQAHQDDDETPLEETLETFDSLVKAGKVRTLGASNFSAARLGASLKLSMENDWARFECLQPLYNLYDRAKYETELEPFCLNRGLGVIPYSSLASGFLTGKYRSDRDLGKSSRGARVKDYLSERGFSVLEALDRVAEKHGSTPARVALAWLLSRPSVTAPVVSTTSLEQLSDILQAADLQLDSTSLERLGSTKAAPAQT